MCGVFISVPLINLSVSYANIIFITIAVELEIWDKDTTIRNTFIIQDCFWCLCVCLCLCMCVYTITSSENKDTLTFPSSFVSP